MRSYFNDQPTFAQWLIDYTREGFRHSLHTQPNNGNEAGIVDLLNRQERLRWLEMQARFERVGIAEPPPRLLDTAQSLWFELESFEGDCDRLIVGARDAESKRRGGFHMPPFGWVRTT